MCKYIFLSEGINMNNDWEFDYQNQYQRGYTHPLPEMQPIQHKKTGGAKKFFAWVGIVALCGAVGFGGGLAGASIAGVGGKSSVVYQAPTNTGTNAMGDTMGTQLSTKQIAAKASPSVVEVTTEALVTDTFFGQQILSGAGSGVIISNDGYIITNNHVIEGATNVKVTLADQTSYDAEIVGRDARTDIAVLKIDGNNLPSATVGNSEELIVGEDVVAIGNPLGSLGGTVTNGIISALNRDIVVGGQTMNLMQTNAAVSPGNSGGGLFDSNGNLIGIVNAKSASTDSEGIGFAIPINIAMQIFTDITEKGYVSGRPTIGITIITISDAQTAMQYNVNKAGLYIQTVTPGSGAEKAGLKQGDRIVAVDGEIISEFDEITTVLSKKAVGDTIQIQVERERRLVDTNVVLGEAVQQ